MTLTAEVDRTLPPANRLPEDGVWNQLNALDLSREEQAFLLEHLEDPPHKALAGWDESIPHNPEEVHGPLQSVNDWVEENPGVNPKAMKKILQRLQEIREVHPGSYGYYKRDPAMAPLIGEAANEEFTGTDAIRQCIEDGQEYMSRFQRIKEKNPGAAVHPSMYMRTGRGKLRYQGVGSDRGRIRRFVCWIMREDIATVDPLWAEAAAGDHIVTAGAEEAVKVSGAGAEFALIEGDNFFECPVEGCNHRTEYKTDDSRSRNMARAQMARHMNSTNLDSDDHREAKAAIFG